MAEVPDAAAVLDMGAAPTSITLDTAALARAIRRRRRLVTTSLSEPEPHKK